MNNHTALYTGPAQFDSQRIFFQSSLDGENTGWYVTVSDKRSYGPFREKEVAIYILNGLLKRLKEAQQRDHYSNYHKQLLNGAPLEINSAASFNLVS